jgi:ankyrin repeat protein
MAALRDHVDIVRLLLEHGADPNIKNKDGLTPLYEAASMCNVECCEAFLGTRRRSKHQK